MTHPHHTDAVFDISIVRYGTNRSPLMENIPSAKGAKVQITAEGMISNFGSNAVMEAKRIAARYSTEKKPLAYGLWVAVVDRIKVTRHRRSF